MLDEVIEISSDDEPIFVHFQPNVQRTVHRRPKTEIPEFRPGNLIRVEMENFLTFSKAVFKPGPRMNLIIGPNGTGKSTIVSAVCIVFGGKPSILGRGSDLAAFVKYGSTTASVIAHVYEPSHPSGYIEVQRVFDIDGCNYFFVDGKKVLLREVKQGVVQKYDIQLDNTTQFMPQEKIAEFTNHKPEEFLKLAIRSLGGAEKEEEYFNLLEDDGKLSFQTESLKKNREQLKKLIAEQEEDHREVEAYWEQRKLRSELELLQSFRPHLEVVETKHLYRQHRDKMNQTEEVIKTLEADLQQIMSGPVNACKQACGVARSVYNSTTASISNCIGRKALLNHQLNDTNNELIFKIRALRDIHIQNEEVQEALQNAKNKLAQAQEAHAIATEISELQLQQQLDVYEEKRQQLRARRREAREGVSPLDDKIQLSNRMTKHLIQRLQGLADVRRQRMERLRRLHNGDMILRVAELVQHMKQNNAFQRRVYGPVLAEVEVEDSYHARIMEHSVGGWLRQAFVLESMKDSRVLLQECRKQLNGFKPDMMTTPTTTDDEIDYETIGRQQPPFPVDDNLRSLGILCTVSDIYQAPDAVRAALNAMASLHTIYVGTDDAQRNQEVLRNNIGLPAWYTPETRCMLSGSRYDQSARNLRVDTSFIYVKGELYKGSISETEKQRDDFKRRIRDEEQKLKTYQSQLNDMKKEEKHVESNLRAMDVEIRRVIEQHAMRKKKKLELERAQQVVDEMKERAVRRDETHLRNDLKCKISGLVKRALEHLAEFTAVTKELSLSLEKHDDASLNCVMVDQQLASEDSKYEKVEQTLNEKKQAFELAEERRQVLKREYIKAKDKKEIAASNVFPDEENSYYERLSIYAPLPLSELDKDIHELDEKIQQMPSSGRGVVDAYNRREQQIKDIKKEITSQEEWFSKRHTDSARRKRVFLAWLHASIQRMRSKFTSLYRRLGCAADIRLLNGSEGDNLKDVTLQVLVSYRKDAELRPISATANSGGEKMCCTMIFCFSLQLEEDRIPPFLVVDELNQGLDPDNEMKIMSMMIEDSAKEMGTQSFVVTPKLLARLPLGVCTKTHIVYNGHVSGKI